MFVLGIAIVSDNNSIAAELALLDSAGDVTRIFIAPSSLICMVFSLELGFRLYSHENIFHIYYPKVSFQIGFLDFYTR